MRFASVTLCGSFAVTHDSWRLLTTVDVVRAIDIFLLLWTRRDTLTKLCAQLHSRCVLSGLCLFHLSWLFRLFWLNFCRTESD
jgi:hypothetical protein